MKQSLAIFLTLLTLCSHFTSIVAQAQEKKKGEWIQLFNGKDLKDWTVKICGHKPGDNFGNTFRVEDGILKVSYDKYEKFDGKFGHLFYKHPFSHYIIRAQYRFTGKQCPGGPGWAIRNSGIMIHGETPEQMTLNQQFPTSIEVQLLGGDGKNKRPTANLCTPGTNVVMNGKLFTPHCTNSKSDTYHGEQWVTVEVEVHGNNKIIHRVNGKKVISYEKPQLDPKDGHAKTLIEGNNGLMLDGGTISLQSESHPVEFRKVELLNLEKTK